MQFIVENYLIMVLIGLFLVFALIGYLVDMLRKDNKNDRSKNENIEPIKTINPLNEEIKINTEDSLLKNYEEEINKNNVKQDK